MPDAPKKQHYFLVAGEIMFRENAESTDLGTIRLNTTIVHGEENFPSRLIGKAQQLLQMIMFKRFEEPGAPNPPLVVDVFIISVSYLGEMTQEEFMAPPEGMELREVDGDQGGVGPAAALPKELR